MHLWVKRLSADILTYVPPPGKILTLVLIRERAFFSKIDSPFPKQKGGGHYDPYPPSFIHIPISHISPNPNPYHPFPTSYEVQVTPLRLIHWFGTINSTLKATPQLKVLGTQKVFNYNCLLCGIAVVIFSGK